MPKKRKDSGRPYLLPDFMTEEELLAMYRNMTSFEIGKKYNVSPNTVRTWIYNIRKEKNNE